jgi:hypothetical protein
MVKLKRWADLDLKSGMSLVLVGALIGGPQGVAQTTSSTPSAVQTPKPAAKAKPAATPKPATPAPTDAGWPRIYTDGTATLAVHQPQVDDWKDFQQLLARAAVEVVPKKGAQKIVAAVNLEAQTDTNFENRSVIVAGLHVTSLRAPGQTEEQAKTLQTLVNGLLPKQVDAVALDRILAYLDPSRVPSRQVEVSTEPPTILVSTKPAVLVMIDGAPILSEIPGTKLTFVANTNWDILKEKDDSDFFLLNGKQWLTAKSLDGSWKPAKKLPKDTAKIPKDENWSDLKLALPLSKTNKDTKAPWVYVTNKPAELILLKGEAKFQPILGTGLSEVTNTDSMLFYGNQDKNYYFLTAGRWFRNAQLRGTWEYASDKLPADFAKIPANHAKSKVLVSVPGTTQASDAVLLASIPQVAVVNRQQAAAEAKVTYIGEPQFRPIEKTELQYAVNTPGDVIKYQDQYYLLQQGVWFKSASASGPWVVADLIPQEIYKIPPSSPKYNTTYVYVTQSDTTTVTTAQTAGYMGLMVGVGVGVAVWGTGYYYPPYYYYGPLYPYPVYWGYPYHSYGAAAWYNPATGFYGRAAVVYGPYGGFGRSAAYNPATGAYVRRAGAYGPYQGAMGTSFYNPRTGAWGGGYRYANPYQGWGEGVVHRGDQWAKGGYYYDERGAIGGIKGSEGGRLVAAGDGENRAVIGRTSDGDLYAGKDGKIYRRDPSGNWQQHGDGGWNNVDYDSLSQEQRQRIDQAKSKAPAAGQRAQTRDAAATRTQPATSNRTTQPRPVTTARPTRDTMGSLDRDASARSRGNQSYGTWRTQSRGSFGGGGFGGRRR